MIQFIKSTMGAVKKYTILDFALFKVCLLAIGILLGVYFVDFFRVHIIVVWAAAVITYIWVMLMTFKVYRG